MDLEEKEDIKQNFWVKCSQVIIKCPGKPDSAYNLAWFLLREDEIVIVNDRADSILTRIPLEGNQHIHSYWEIWGKWSHTYKESLLILKLISWNSAYSDVDLSEAQLDGSKFKTFGAFLFNQHSSSGQSISMRYSDLLQDVSLPFMVR